MHTHYFLQLGHCNATKNKLQHEAYFYFKSLDGKLITKEQLSEMKQRIVSEIEKLNNKYQRMKPIEVKFNSYNNNNTIFVQSAEAISFKIYSAELVVTEQLPYFSPTLN